MSKQTVLLVSKAHQQSVKRLYKIILQLHKSLPGEIQQIGNSYARSEFKLHKNATPEHTYTFMREWSNYAKTLMKQVNPKFKLKIGSTFNESNVNLDDFSDTQITQLYELFLETTRQKRTINPTGESNT